MQGLVEGRDGRLVFARGPIAITIPPVLVPNLVPVDAPTAALVALAVLGRAGHGGHALAIAVWVRSVVR